jgi:hypothetical protein
MTAILEQQGELPKCFYGVYHDEPDLSQMARA